MTEPNPTKRNWLRIFSPCILASLFSVVVIIMGIAQSNESGGWSMLGAIIFFPALLILIAVDFVTKLLVKENTFTLWLIQSLLIVLGVFIFFKIMG